jgi:peptidyl-dipeptidase Dcp
MNLRSGVLTGAISACGLLSACALTPPAPTSTMSDPVNLDSANPFAQSSTLPLQYPPFDRIDDADFMPAFEAGMAAQRGEALAIASDPATPDFDNTIVALERSGRLLNRVSAVFFNLASSHSNDTIRGIEQEISPRLSEHNDGIYLDPALFERIERLYEQRDTLGLDAESVRLIEKYRTDFVRAGAQLDAAQQRRMRAINAELSSATTEFEQNLLNDSNDSAILVDDRAELDGLSTDAIAAAAEAARERGLEQGWLIGLQLPTVQTVLSSIRSRALRERIYRASIARGNRGNAYDNKALVLRIVALRAERAALLGYPSHAAYVLEDSTARTVDAVDRMLGELAPAAVRNAESEAAALQALIDAQGGGFELQPWDWPYYAEQLRKVRYDFDESELRPYLEMERVLQDGVFHMARELYGLKFVERHDLPVYHPDVRVFDVFNEDGSRLGIFMADYFARPSKRGGAWMNSFVDQSGLFGTQAVVVNNLNVPKPPAGEPVLLSFDDANTMFHEFGHALHGLFSQVRYPYFSGTNVPRDFVEFPSQVHEMWSTDPQVLAHYARHYQTGAPMPPALIEKLLAAQQFNQGFATTEYLAASLLDQAWHQIGADAGVDDVIAFEGQALKDNGVSLKTVLPRYRSTYFNHVFAGGYSAGYYAYIWSEVLDADTVEWFKQHGGLKRQNGDAFRERLLSRGGSRDAMSLYRDFRGRDPQIAPLLVRRGLTATGG